MLPVDLLGCQAEDAETLFAPVAEALLYVCPRGGIQRMGVLSGLQAGAGAQNIIQCTLGDEGMLTLGIGGDHTQPFAHKIVGDFVHLLLGADIQPGLLSGSLNRIIQRIGQPGLVVCVEIGVAQNGRGGLPLCIVCAVETDDTFGERAGLVGAEHVHAAKVLNGGQAAHDHAAFGHLLCTVGECDTDYGGQELRRQTDRQRQRKEQRVQQRLF